MNQRQSDKTQLVPPGLLRDVERLCDQFHSDWEAGDKPRIEAFLDQIDGPDQNRLLHELLLIEI
ncbi:MAG: hypothetical protein ABGZ17_14505, partial [Planctomycetaceae bacterium]